MTLRDPSSGRFVNKRDQTHEALRRCVRERVLDQAVRCQAYVAAYDGSPKRETIGLLKMWEIGFMSDWSKGAIRREFSRLMSSRT